MPSSPRPSATSAPTGRASTSAARIAREMHDVLGHRISQISMQAGAMVFREDLSGDELREGAALIRDNANDALTDLRGVLGVLRDTETGRIIEPPQPTYDDVPRLVASARAAGMRIAFEDGLSPSGPGMPARVGPHGLPDPPGGAHQRRQARPRRDGHPAGVRAAPVRAWTWWCATLWASPGPASRAPVSAWSGWVSARS